MCDSGRGYLSFLLRFFISLECLQIIHCGTGKVLAQNDTSFVCDGSSSTCRVSFRVPVEITPGVTYIASACLKVSSKARVNSCSLTHFGERVKYTAILSGNGLALRYERPEADCASVGSRRCGDVSVHLRGWKQQRNKRRRRTDPGNHLLYQQ